MTPITIGWSQVRKSSAPSRVARSRSDVIADLLGPKSGKHRHLELRALAKHERPRRDALQIHAQVVEGLDDEGIEYFVFVPRMDLGRSAIPPREDGTSRARGDGPAPLRARQGHAPRTRRTSPRKASRSRPGASERPASTCGSGQVRSFDPSSSKASAPGRLVSKAPSPSWWNRKSISCGGAGKVGHVDRDFALLPDSVQPSDSLLEKLAAERKVEENEVMGELEVPPLAPDFRRQKGLRGVAVLGEPRGVAVARKKG